MSFKYCSPIMHVFILLFKCPGEEDAKAACKTRGRLKSKPVEVDSGGT